MTRRPNQNSTLAFRIPTAHRDLLESAAALELTSLSEFCRRALVAAARETAKEHRARTAEETT